MNRTEFVNELLQGLNTVLSTLPPEMGEGLRKGLQHSAMTTLKKLDFVSQEEFEIQKKVLQKTRAKLERMEKQLDALVKGP